MGKTIVKLVAFNIAMMVAVLVIATKRGFGLNFLNFYQTPFRFGISWTMTVFWLGIFVYFNYLQIKDLSIKMKHRVKLVVKDVVLNDVQEAMDKLKVAEREDVRLASEIVGVWRKLEEFQRKLDILKQLLANHGKKLSDWDWVPEFNEEAQKEILANVREVIDTLIIFDNETANQTQLENANKKIQESTDRIDEILKKYDEFLDIVQKILEKKLRKKGIVATDSLEITLNSAKKVYGVFENKQ